MEYDEVVHAAFLEELEKIAFSKKLLKVFQARKGRRFRMGRRSLRAATLLKKYSEYTPTLGSSPGETVVENPVRKKKRRDEVPSREDMNSPPEREDGRNSATTVHGQSTTLNDIGNYPTEHP